MNQELCSHSYVVAVVVISERAHLHTIPPVHTYTAYITKLLATLTFFQTITLKFYTVFYVVYKCPAEVLQSFIMTSF